MKTIRWPIALMVLGILVLALPLVASADHSWGGKPNDPTGYHWERTVNPLVLFVGDNASDKWDGHLEAANTDWNNVPGVVNEPVALKLSVGEGNGSSTCTPDTGGVEICNDD